MPLALLASLTWLTDYALKILRTQVLLAPISTDAGATSLATSQKFPASGEWAPGDSFVASANGEFHIVAGTSAVAATTSSPIFTAGTHAFTLPDGCTHVAMIQGAAGAAKGQAYKG